MWWLLGSLAWMGAGACVVLFLAGGGPLVALGFGCAVGSAVLSEVVREIRRRRERGV